MARKYVVELALASPSAALADRFVFSSDRLAQPAMDAIEHRSGDRADHLRPATDDFAQHALPEFDALAAAAKVDKHPVHQHNKLELPVAQFGPHDEGAATWKHSMWHDVPLV
jgi:hypothetical protein